MTFISQAYLGSLSVEKHEQLFATHMHIGKHPETGDELLLPERDRYAGTYVLGVQGVGKSALLENCIAYDAACGNAVVVIDAHGDLISNVLAQLPLHRLSQTYLLDMEDEAYPFGVNVFATGKLTTSVAYAQAVNRIMHIFEVLWEEVLSQAYLPRYVRAATITLLSNPGATLVDMHTFLLNEKFRHAMLHNVVDQSVRDFWQTQYDDLSHSEQMRRVQPLIGRLEALFMGRSLVRNIVGQRQTTINFRRAIENRELILIKLPIKTLSQDARLVGTILLAQIHAAIFSFADIPEHQRPGLSLYVDEFQHFSTSDFAELLTEGRKFGVKVTVAHQYRSQLPKYLQASTLTARTKICFQTTPEDGREMAHLFPDEESVIRPEDMNAHVSQHLLDYGSDNPFVVEFIEWYLRPLQGQRRGQRVEIQDTGFSMSNTIADMINGGRGDNPRVADPTPYLDSLLYQVMRTGDSNLPLSFEVIRGFANCGHSFYAYLQRSFGSDLLRSDVRYPPALAVLTANGGVRWTRPPENGREQLYHLLFHLRLTMQQLALEPIGKPSPSSTTDVGRMLTNLPRRAAFVRSGQDIGVIYTHNTAPRLAGQAFTQRVQTIREQTRVKYCHPRQAVEQLFKPLIDEDINNNVTPVVSHPLQQPKKEPTPISRWEDA